MVLLPRLVLHKGRGKVIHHLDFLFIVLPIDMDKASESAHSKQWIIVLSRKEQTSQSYTICG